MGLNHLQSLICTYSADDLRPLMGGHPAMYYVLPRERCRYNILSLLKAI